VAAGVIWRRAVVVFGNGVSVSESGLMQKKLMQEADAPAGLKREKRKPERFPFSHGPPRLTIVSSFQNNAQQV
jgi:hypothetical protein